MEFDCVTAPISKMMTNAMGVKQPLCNDCANPDCSNPIRAQTLSIMGVPQKWRVWCVGTAFRQVIECKGYLPVGADES